MYSIGNGFWLGGRLRRGDYGLIDSQSFQYANDKIYYTGERGLRYVPQDGGSGQGTEVYTSNTYVLDGERGVYWTRATDSSPISGISHLKREAFRFRLPKRTAISEDLRSIRTKGKMRWFIRSRQ